MAQKPRSIGGNVWHDASFEVTKTVALESGETASGAHVESGQVSVVVTLDIGEHGTLHFGWTPEIARGLGELLIEQADAIDRE